MWLKKAYDYVYDHNILNKVVAGLITAGIVSLIGYINRPVKDLGFFKTIGNYLSYEIPVWVSLLSFVLLATSIIVIYERKKPTTALVQSNQFKLVITPVFKKPSDLAETTIFNSGLSDETWWRGYGQQDWDKQKKQLFGDKGIGDYLFQNDILTISRENKEGRYVIALVKLYYKMETVTAIPSNMSAESPRKFFVAFEGRAFSGQHRVIIVLRNKDGYDWLDSKFVDISSDSWILHSKLLSVKPDKSFVIELHTYSDALLTRFQIKNFFVMEADKESMKNISVQG